jgi:aminoglycoside phosphotransferase (APT) family kinase protein
LAKQLLEDGGELIYERFSKCLIKHACGQKVTKMNSSGIRVSEVEAMRCVAENTTIPVPRVYEVGDRYYTMDFIEGEPLRELWDKKFNEEDRALVRRQLRGYINQMRAIKSPDGVICTFGYWPAVDRRMFLHEGGPFTNESDNNDFLTSDLHKLPITEILREQLRKTEGHEIVFTHGDLHAINILARPGEGIIAIIDWEVVGFYPEYFDFVKPYRPANWGCGYYPEFFEIFPKRYDAEFVVDQLLSQYARH